MSERFIVALVLLASFAGASESEFKNVRLENGHELRVERISPSRILPHAYYDQALVSIHSVYPDSQIIAKRRAGHLGKHSRVLYSMVCYKKSKDGDEITIGGVVTIENKAWSFNAEVVESSFIETLVLLLEALADLPFDKALQP